MRVRSIALAACCATLMIGASAHAQVTDTMGARSRFVLNATTSLGAGLCIWGGTPYSDGAQILVSGNGNDPHVVPHFFTCKAGAWTQE